jgi:hypothetical protein
VDGASSTWMRGGEAGGSEGARRVAARRRRALFGDDRPKNVKCRARFGGKDEICRVQKRKALGKV